MKNPILFVLILLFIITNLADSITAFFILPGEANPLFILTGSIWVVIFMKIIIIALVIFYYKRNKYANHLMYYLLIVILVVSTILLALAVYGNISGILNPKLIEEASKISNVEKIKQYSVFVLILYCIPLIFTVGSFLLYDYSSKYVSFDEEYFKKKKWWQRW